MKSHRRSRFTQEQSNSIGDKRSLVMQVRGHCSMPSPTIVFSFQLSFFSKSTYIMQLFSKKGQLPEHSWLLYVLMSLILYNGNQNQAAILYAWFASQLISTNPLWRPPSLLFFVF